MLTKKEKLIVKIVISVLALITIGLLVELLIEYFVLKDHVLSYFAEHFTSGICLVLIGIIAFLLPTIGRQKYSDGKGDDLMLVVAVLLILCGIISIIWSYIG